MRSCCRREQLVGLGEPAVVAAGAGQLRTGQAVAVVGHELVGRLGSGTW